jgi:hypothetical protein
MAAKVCFGTPKRGNFTVRAMHEFPVPDESKDEDETKGCEECDREFFPIHNFFLLRFLLKFRCALAFIAKWLGDVDPNLVGQRSSHRPVAGQDAGGFLVDGSLSRG